MMAASAFIALVLSPMALSCSSIRILLRQMSKLILRERAEARNWAIRTALEPLTDHRWDLGVFFVQLGGINLGVVCRVAVWFLVTLIIGLFTYRSTSFSKTNHTIIPISLSRNRHVNYFISNSLLKHVMRSLVTHLSVDGLMMSFCRRFLRRFFFSSKSIICFFTCE